MKRLLSDKAIISAKPNESGEPKKYGDGGGYTFL